MAWTEAWSQSVENKAREAGLPIVDLNEAQTALEEGRVLFLDARPHEQYQQGHIPGALSLPVHNLDAHLPAIQPFLFPEQPMIVYCGGETCEDSILLGTFLLDQEMQDVKVFKGGMDAWRAASLPEDSAL